MKLWRGGVRIILPWLCIGCEGRHIGDEVFRSLGGEALEAFRQVKFRYNNSLLLISTSLIVYIHVLTKDFANII